MNTNKKISALVLLAVGIFSNAQIKTNNTINATIGGESVYLDASSFPSSNNLGKGLSVPRTNLTTFTFVTQVTNALKFPTAYDGMIVYNSVAGTTPATGSGIGNQPVSVGFYYFSNPTPTPAFSSASGQWLPLGGSGKENILTTETVTNRQVNNAQIYGIKGTFAANGTTTAVTIPAPSGITAMYGITIYKAGTNTVYSRELYSYDTSTGAAVTGSPSMSVVYPSGTYDYVLEYLK
ncbi:MULTISPECIES: hypothetical protein [Chryseobacterium]|uniref:Uncharacterized protein n=1 Tax=Chryseobacterium cucumeris TaxID=1813611 RepID=A0ABX9X3G4_9FLAO|nr:MULTISPECIES: hypothetical protein [Chryseobacterium]KYH05502.1 hypothetical protein A1704_10375 [Chryseobacterium cucumeris]MDH5032051.1 hypothetical protein [Chryseobacterium cucumeris]QWT85718.1 hypothetical protein KBP46_20120 [Chryseobacterium sp. PCH239]RKE82864.1 hypothetical protein DEU39_2426 [Chryseobacterium sp. AG363]ROH90327.1 hypothetical protein EGI15_16800 [Chryseobacterium cucumeris]